MDTANFYLAAGGRDACRRLSENFYGRVKSDPVLRPFFPGKTLRCAINAFAAFLAQFLGGPPEDAEERWFLSLRESHARFRIGPRERDAWLRTMREALEETPLDESIRVALRDFFEHSSAYLIHASPGHPVHPELARRWTEQRALDDLVAAIRAADSTIVLALAQSPTLQSRFARDRAVLAQVLGLLLQRGDPSLLAYAERELQADPALATIPGRYGRTLLHDAAAYGSLRFVELLLRLGADPNSDPGHAHPPLYCLANECRTPAGPAIVRTLVKAGAHVDVRTDSKRCTPLHVAARRGNAEIAAALLECGADIEAQDVAGVTPLQRARNCRKPALVALLTQTEPRTK